MPCYGLIVPGTDAPRFLSTPTWPPRSDPAFRVKPLTRIQFPSFRTKAVVSDSVAAELSFYELLGISESGSLPEIKQAYKQLARKYHPDVSPPDRVDEHTKRFIQVQEAYETLSDPRRRALYDRDMARGLHLAFSARRRYQCQNEEDLDGKSVWKNRWESQLTDLKRRSMSKDTRGNASWAARMRRQREESSKEL